QPRHFVVPQLFHVLQQERFALLRPEPPERAVDLLAPRALLRRVILRRLVQRHFVGHERAGASPTPRANRTTAIYENAKKPSPETFRIFATGERSIRSGERVLQRLFRILAIAEHVQRIPRVPISVPRYQLGVQLDITAKDASDDLRVRTTIHE